MSTPTIHVLGVSAAEETFSSIEDKSSASPRLRLHGRIAIHNQDDRFDQVKIRLQGAIRSTIGSKVAVEKLNSSTEVLSALAFKPAYSASRQMVEEQHLDFSCPLPSSAPTREARQNKSSRNGNIDGFVPSMSLTGSTYITRVTAIRDRHLVEGRCDVVYWLEAEFVHSRSGHVVRRLSCPVDVSSLHTLLQVEVSSNQQSESVERIAKPQTRSLRYFGSHSQPEVLVSVPRKLGFMVSDSSRLATGCRKLSIPVSVNIRAPTNARRQAQSLMSDSLKCSVKTQWYTRRAFSTGSLAIESVVKSDTVSTQKLALTLPPPYSSTLSDSSYTTHMELNLLVPESATNPSISTDLLSISYTLDLAMKFEMGNDDNVKSTYNAGFSLPVTIRTAQPEAILSRFSVDPLLGSLPIVEQYPSLGMATYYIGHHLSVAAAESINLVSKKHNRPHGITQRAPGNSPNIIF
ncbi:hypothetical protein LTR99_001617 [Exophiala xenobiotica]|uniref:Arrestin-like N-terminal domain-containing protein n=1 Tax=Vermiconidia calcicola TaxID=1690605 RepID=A0AAV9QJB6_9PEZI|nr:hypothetical protein LTR99_001617 [Exophiala xenobiotica]KAK5438143.1 hypothetical protein LTR34_001691 [Exophiala xenobiotica]KAK5544126.1 hypothetical protein LTR25_001741 [Vermiconidia calcicola]